MKKKKWPLIIFILIILIMAGIGGVFYYNHKMHSEDNKKDTSKKNSNSTIVKPNVKILDGDSELQPIEVDDNTLVFNKKPNYKKNDVVVAGIIDEAPDGFIRKILNVKKSGKKYKVQTENAMLTDVFEEAHVIKTFEIGEDEIEEADSDYKIVPLKSGDSGEDSEEEYLISKSFEYEEDEVKAEGEIGFNAYLQVVMEIEHGNIKFGIAETNEGTGKLDMSYKLEKEMKDKNKTFYSRKIPNYEFLVAGVPIVITNQIEASCGAKAKGEIDINVDSEAKAKDTVGFLYDSRTGKIEKVNTYERDSSGINWKTAGKAKGEASADLIFHLISKLYGSTGTDLGVGVGGNASGEVQISAKKDLMGYAGKIDLSLSPKVTGKIIVEKPIVDKKLKEKELFNKDLDPFWSKEWKSSDEWKKDLTWTETGEQRTGIFDSTYKTRYGEINAVTCPKFEFSYPSNRWKVTNEMINEDPIAENVTISNNRNVEINYWACNKELGGGAHLSQIAEITKVADSSFHPSIPDGTDSDFSYLGNFIVAKIHIIKENDGSSEEYTDVNGENFYAVIPESKIGEEEFWAQAEHIDAFSWEYPSNYAFIATSPDGRFTLNEEQNVIEILKSFKSVEE